MTPVAHTEAEKILGRCFLSKSLRETCLPLTKTCIIFLEIKLFLKEITRTFTEFSGLAGCTQK